MEQVDNSINQPTRNKTLSQGDQGHDLENSPIKSQD